ncbi:hypothetical protein GCM10011507_14430 [Edaphobacter acidisoli]|uniref:Abnormal spindle-like microcephaly-associated protein ASH domain-containing protein n=1 Tax=Edaphobacter acidisoli TaxID=2040573 RepID=A0A916W3X4_9BACT|nr:choice-of-anchor D domain-containing protein [Edaphobacter acidisoli]GGA63932.1 hypothetical protein GCM10011507_14430 [Edaphobacter acidisoli]
MRRATQIVLTVLMFLPIARAQTSMTISSLTGPVTSTESSSFLSYMAAQTPAANNIGNNWAQGASGEAVKAMGMVYEITQNTAVLDQMIRFCDTLLSERDDLASAPTGQLIIWTGHIDPVWPGTTTTPIQTAGEQGDAVGHLGNCARLILETPSIWDNNVAIGDPDGYGTTYLARAKTYVAQADVAVSGHILKSELDISNSNHYYFSVADPYKSGQPVPWNQVAMFNYGFQNLAIDHQILGDNSTLEAQYYQLVQANINWFFTSGYTEATDSDGNPTYSWDYAYPTTPLEDNNHGSLDLNGFYRAYVTGEYGITPAMMTPFGYTFNDIMTLGPGDYSGFINGTTGSGNQAATNYIRSGWLLMADFMPSSYDTAFTSADFVAGGTTTNADRFSKLLWMKNERYQSFTLTTSTPSQTIPAGSSATYPATIEAQGAFAGTVNFSVLNFTGLPTGVTATFSAPTVTGGGSSTLTLTTTSATPNGTYPITILASSMGQVTQTATVNLVVASQILNPAGPLSFTTTSGTTSATQIVTLSNPGTAALAITSISLTGTDAGSFTETNHCGASLGAGASCVISLAFAPTSTGSDTAMLTVTDNAIGSPQTVALVGTSVAPVSADFNLSASPSSLTVTAGNSTSSTLTVSAIGGTVNGPVMLSASGVPGATITFSPASVSPGSGTATSIMTVQVSSSLAMIHASRSGVMGGIMSAILLPWLFLRRRPHRRSQWHATLSLLVLLLGAFGLLCGCQGSQNPVGKNYTISISGASGTNTHITTISLTVR